MNADALVFMACAAMWYCMYRTARVAPFGDGR